jgi:hypothetical protein
MNKNWQPIDTAPKHSESKSGRRVPIIVTRYPAKGDTPYNLVRWGRLKAGNSNHRGWVTTTGIPLRYEPTHWHPCPPLD